MKWKKSIGEKYLTGKSVLPLGYNNVLEEKQRRKEK